jgi:hypothetical protein
MFVVPTSTSKRLLITRPVSAGFPCLNVNYAHCIAVNSDGTFRGRTELRAMTIAAISLDTIREDVRCFFDGRGKTNCGFFVSIPKHRKSCKPSQCSPHLRACRKPRRTPTTPRLPFSRYIRMLLSATKPQFCGRVPFWMVLAMRSLPTTSAITSRQFREVLP